MNVYFCVVFQWKKQKTHLFSCPNQCDYRCNWNDSCTTLSRSVPSRAGLTARLLSLLCKSQCLEKRQEMLRPRQNNHHCALSYCCCHHGTYVSSRRGDGGTRIKLGRAPPLVVCVCGFPLPTARSPSLSLSITLGTTDLEVAVVCEKRCTDCRVTVSWHFPWTFTTLA